MERWRYSISKYWPNRFTATSARLKDGTSVILRAARPADARAVDAMHERVSSQSLYFRYLSTAKPDSELTHRLCGINRRRGAALVAVRKADGAVIAMACFVKGAQGAAEPGILVEDQYQGMGLGRRLWERLVRYARSAGVVVFDAVVHPDNDPVMGLVCRCPEPVLASPDRDGTGLQIFLDQDRFFEAALFRGYGMALPCGLSVH